MPTGQSTPRTHRTPRPPRPNGFVQFDSKTVRLSCALNEGDRMRRMLLMDFGAITPGGLLSNRSLRQTKGGNSITPRQCDSSRRPCISSIFSGLNNVSKNLSKSVPCSLPAVPPAPGRNFRIFPRAPQSHVTEVFCPRARHAASCVIKPWVKGNHTSCSSVCCHCFCGSCDVTVGDLGLTCTLPACLQPIETPRFSSPQRETGYSLRRSFNTPRNKSDKITLTQPRGSIDEAFAVTLKEHCRHRGCCRHVPGRCCKGQCSEGQTQTCMSSCSKHQNISCGVKQNFSSPSTVYFPVFPKKEDVHAVPPPPPRDTLGVVQLRRLLPKIANGDHVLFRCPDTGWYFPGTVADDCHDFSYVITDCNGHQELIWREHIILESDNMSEEHGAGDKVIVQHPTYRDSYAPGMIMSQDASGVIVQLYDGTLTESKDFKTWPTVTYTADVKYMEEMANRWVGESVIARADSGGYYTGKVVSRAGVHKYRIKWGWRKIGSGRAHFVKHSHAKDNQVEAPPFDVSQVESPHTRNNQIEGCHVFGCLTPVQSLKPDGHVLAPRVYTSEFAYYLPAVVKDLANEKEVIVDFVDCCRESLVEKDLCFWISPNYYYEAVSAYINGRK